MGCGDGDLTSKTADAVGASAVRGVDVDEASLARARAKGISVLERDLDAEALPFDDESFDLVTAIEVIEHLRNPCNMLRGAFLVETPNAAGCSCRFVADQLKLALLSDRWPRLAEAMVEARGAAGFDPISLRGVLAEVCFEVLKVFGFSNVPHWLPLSTVALEGIAAGSLSTTPHIIAVATKR